MSHAECIHEEVAKIEDSLALLEEVKAKIKMQVRRVFLDGGWNSILYI